MLTSILAQPFMGRLRIHSVASAPRLTHARSIAIRRTSIAKRPEKSTDRVILRWTG
jgi:hypothetical protein